MDSRDSLLATLVAAIWGFNFIAIEWGMDGVPPLLFLTIRFAVVLIPAIFLVPRPQARWSTILSVGALMSLGQFAFLYLALDAGMSPGLAALVLQAQVLFTMIIAAAMLGERPNRLQVGGIVVGFVGLIVVAVGRGGDVSLVPFGLCLLGALSWGAGNVVSRSSGIKGGFSLTVWSALVVPVPALVLSLLVDGPEAIGSALGSFGWRSALSTLYTAGLSSLVGYGIFNTLLSRNRSADVASFILLVPVVAIACSALLLDQIPNAAEILGAILMVAAVLVIVRASRSVPMESDASGSAVRDSVRAQTVSDGG